MELSFLITKALKFFGPSTTIGKWLRDIQEKKSYKLYHLAKSIGLDSEKKNFDVIYHNALKKLGDALPRETFELFNLAAVREAYKNEFYRKGLQDGVMITLRYQMAANDLFATFAYSINDVEAHFRGLIEKEIFASLSVQELHQEARFDNLEEKVVAIDEKIDSMGVTLTQITSLMGMQPHAGDSIIPIVVASVSRNYEGRVGQIITLVHEGHRKAAVALYDSFLTEELTAMDDVQRYDLEIYIGKAYFELGEQKLAAEHLISLPQYKCTSAEAFGAAAIGYAVKGDIAMAITFANKALGIDPSNALAVVAKIDALPKDCTFEQIQMLLAPELMANPMIAVDVARRINTSFPEHYQQAINMLLQVKDYYMAGTMEHAEIKELLAIIQSQTAVKLYLQCGKVLTPAVKALLEKSITNYNEAWDFYKNSDLREIKWHVPANRAISHKMLEKYREAERDFYESLNIKPTEFSYLNLIALKAFANESPHTVISEARNALQLSPQTAEDIATMEIKALLDENRPDDAIALIDKRPPVDDPETAIKWASLKSHALMMTGRRQEALHLIMHTVTQYPDSPHANFTATLALLACDDVPQAVSYLQRTADLLPVDAELNMIDALTKLAFQLQQHSLVISILDKERFTKHKSPFTFSLLDSLYLTGQIDRAVEIAAPFYDKNIDEPPITNILIEHYMLRKNYSRALQIVENALKIDANNPYYHARRLAILLLQGKTADASIAATTVPEALTDDRSPFEVYFSAYKSADCMHGDQVLQWALDRRARHFDQDNTHNEYISLFNAMSNEGHREPALHKVEHNNGILLSTEDGQERLYYIADSSASTSPELFDLYKAVLDKCVGDKLITNNVPYTVKRIMTRSECAFWESMAYLQQFTTS